jgi:hypothetical protein
MFTPLGEYGKGNFGEYYQPWYNQNLAPEPSDFMIKGVSDYSKTDYVKPSNLVNLRTKARVDRLNKASATRKKFVKGLKSMTPTIKSLAQTASQKNKFRRTKQKLSESKRSDRKKQVAREKKVALDFMMKYKPRTLTDCEKELKKVKRKLKKEKQKCKVKKTVKKNTGGLSAWRDFLNNYRSQNPNMSYRQAQKQASILYKQR